MMNRLISTARNDSALIRKHHAAPNCTSAIPAAVGPSTRPRLFMIELRAMPLCMSSRPTNSTTIDWREGVSSALVMPSSTAKHEDVPDLNHVRRTPAPRG